MSIATANVNGIRAAYRRGMHGWMQAHQPQLLCLQEVRAPDAILRELLGPEWHVGHAEAETKGRAGVAVASRREIVDTRIGVGPEEFATTGRWVECDVRLDDGRILTAVSAYVHTGEADTPRQDEKLAFLDAMLARMKELRDHTPLVLVTGDLNVAHQQVDIKNWKGNLKKSGFLPSERAYLDDLFQQQDWVDLGRHLGGPGPGPYTWWSWRGQAFDNDTGWRIDYQIASPELAATATAARVDRAPSYAERWSDHAPLTVSFTLD